MVKLSQCALNIAVNFLLFNAVFATIYEPQWRWLSGGSFGYHAGVGGSPGQFDASFTPGGREACAMTPADSSSTVYIFGGSGKTTTDHSGHLNDIWAYKQTTWNSKGMWAFIGGISDEVNVNGQYQGSQPYPGTRKASVAWVDSNSNIFIFGGRGLDGIGGESELSDLWKFSIPTKQFSWLSGSSIRSSKAVFGSLGVTSATNVPGAVANHVFLGLKADSALVFGGRGKDQSVTGELGAVWSYVSSQWTWINGASKVDQPSLASSPGGRMGCAVLRSDSHAWIYGGYGRSSGGIGDLADLWKYDLGSNQWQYVTGESIETGSHAIGSFAPPYHPGARSYANGWYDKRGPLLMLFGGEGYAASTSMGRLSDTWVFNMTSSLWTWTAGSSIVNHGGHYTSVNESFTVANQPKSRWLGASSSVSDVMLLFGGFSVLNDLMSTRGSTIPVPSPTATVTPSPTSTSTPTTSPTVSPYVPTPIPTVTPTPKPAGLSTGAIIGIVAGVSTPIAIGIAVALGCFKKKDRGKSVPLEEATGYQEFRDVEEVGA